MQRKPDLIVPIRDRRQHKRYLTLRNAAKAFAVFSVVFLAITIRSEMQPRHGDGFGRLLQKEMPKVEAKPVEVVHEAPAPVPDQTAADPMLVAPAAREQWLYDDRQQPTTAASLQPVPSNTATVTAPVEGDSRFAIVGGSEGVTLVEQTQHRRVLRGGFGR
jgi:hypothetical protein